MITFHLGTKEKIICIRKKILVITFHLRMEEKRKSLRNLKKKNLLRETEKMSIHYKLTLDLSTEYYALIKFYMNNINIGNIKFDISTQRDSIFHDLDEQVNMIERKESFTVITKTDNHYYSQIEYDNKNKILYFAILDIEEFPIAEICLPITESNEKDICSDLRTIYAELCDNWDN
jgi:hypothetical protein